MGASPFIHIKTGRTTHALKEHLSEYRDLSEYRESLN